MFQRHLKPEDSLLYPDFLNDLCKLIVSVMTACILAYRQRPNSLSLQVTDFTDKVNSYVMNAVMFFKSMWSEVKSNAALFVGESL
jgi:hypothetical protein